MPTVVPFDSLPRTQQEGVYFVYQLNANLQAISDLIDAAHATRPGIVFVEPGHLMLEYIQVNFGSIRDTLVGLGRPDIGQPLANATELNEDRLQELNAGLAAAVDAV